MRRIRYAVERSRTKAAAEQGKTRLGKVIPVIGAKGGSGTTTLTVNLGYALNQQGYSVIALELGREPGFSSHIQVPSPKNWSALIDRSEILPANLEDIFVRLVRGYSLVCSPAFDLAADPLNEVSAMMLVDACRRTHQYVLVDCPSLLQNSTLAVLKESDDCLFLLERSQVGVSCAKQQIAALAANGVAPGKLRAIVVNKSSFLESLSLEELQAELPVEKLCVIPPGGEELAHKSVVLSPNERPNDSLFAETIRHLARVLLQGREQLKPSYAW